MRATIQRASKLYVQEQAQHLGGKVKRQDLDNAAKKVSRVLEELATAKLHRNK